MLNFAGLSIAMGNSEEVVKEIADHITETNDQSGVAKALYRHILKKELK